DARKVERLTVDGEDVAGLGEGQHVVATLRREGDFHDQYQVPTATRFAVRLLLIEVKQYAPMLADVVLWEKACQIEDEPLPSLPPQNGFVAKAAGKVQDVEVLTKSEPAEFVIVPTV